MRNAYMNYRFMAIDFETATHSNCSACSIGLVIYENDVEVLAEHHLIQPPGNEYLAANIKIHGITPEMTENIGLFPEIWKKIAHLFDDALVVAHNASFDMGVLKSTLTLYDLPYPNFKFFDSIRIGKLNVKEKTRLNLKDLSAYYGIDLSNHHNALCDASACAQIVVYAINNNNSYSELETLLKNTNNLRNFSDVKVYPHKVLSNFIPKYQDKPTYDDSDLVNLWESSGYRNDDLPLSNIEIVFTGELNSYPRNVATMLVEALGAKVRNVVTRRTNLLICSSYAYSTKLENAVKLMESGHNIKIINEKMFLSLLKQYEKD